MSVVSARRTLRGSRIALLLGLGLGGCATQEMVHRSALVPAITPPLATGQAIDNGRAQLTFANSTYLRSQKPVQTSVRSNAGLYIPRSQFGLQALFRLGRDWALGPKLEIGLNQGADPIAELIAPKPDGPTVCLGPAAFYSIPVASFFRIGLELETLIAFAPYSKFVIGQGYEYRDSGVDTTLVLNLAVIPSFRFGPVTIFAGVAGRNQPTNTKEEIRSTAYTDQAFEDEVRFGPMYAVLFGGLQVRLWRRFELTAQLYHPLHQEPVEYGGPALAVWLGAVLGDPWKPRVRPAPYYPYGPPPRYPQPYAPQPPPPPPPYAPQPAPPAPPPTEPGPVDIH